MHWLSRGLMVGMLGLCLSMSRPALGQPLDPSEIQMILGEHNAARCQVTPPAVSMPALVWDTALARVAQDWASRGSFTHNADRANEYKALGGSGSVGESIAFGSSLAQIVKLWVDERYSYIFGPLTTGNFSTVGHYMQVVWADTTRLGCGSGRISGQPFLVCNYSDAGNFLGQSPYKPGSGVNASCAGAMPPSTNKTPIANAGTDQTVASGDEVTLDGSESSDPEDMELLFSWIQVGGPAVTLESSDSDEPSFTAPNVPASSPVLTFELVVSDGIAISAVDTIEVRVTNAKLPAGTAKPSGVTSPTASPGPRGPQEQLGPAVPRGAVIYLNPSAPPPAGFTFTGRSSFLTQRPNGRVDLVTLFAYRKN